MLWRRSNSAALDSFDVFDASLKGMLDCCRRVKACTAPGVASLPTCSVPDRSMRRALMAIVVVAHHWIAITCATSAPTNRCGYAKPEL